MKRFLPLVLALVISCLVVWGGNEILASKIAENYDPAFGYKLNTQKNQGLILQRTGMEKGGSIPVYGSSELSGSTDPFQPVNFFTGQYAGIYYNLIGRGYCQSLIHLINFGALGDSLKGEKIVFFLSPQWFSKTGITSDDFQKNFSQQQYLTFLNNEEISPQLKRLAAQRVDSLLGQDESMDMRILSYLSANNAEQAQIFLGALQPYYRLKEALLSTKDHVQGYRTLVEESPHKGADKSNSKPAIERSAVEIDWESEKKRAQEVGKARSDNNQFGIDNGYFNDYLKEKLPDYKDSMHDQSYLESPEYGDLELLLSLCQELEIEPLFVSIPVNGLWYDYCGFPREDRAQYYEKVKQLVTKAGYEFADFSDHEYDPYFLRDTMHLGWKGWVEVNEAILAYVR
ncbi:D-alanyl-lipoteichoic acid biosynthesis protein DltD [Desulfitobacterium chlororespirans]|uniref:Protein DltD n=1 Tax=Desulfitobacterium chlororespirans DSM 11544 TaxID=1121395 RepID=A0A1M7UZW1_9FIRM|nr:D-alanyl-lipoteichoic acid biosynthesis protein DltD [Desulfitobacterium chlororespirans]SHN88482.1 D-alanine transfer protein [Desulfitobacterium chlororespirans DSM 11544]